MRGTATRQQVASVHSHHGNAPRCRQDTSHDHLYAPVGFSRLVAVTIRPAPQQVLGCFTAPLEDGSGSHMDLRLGCTGYSASQAGEGPRVPGVIMKPAVTRRCEQVEPKAGLLWTCYVRVSAHSVIVSCSAEPTRHHRILDERIALLSLGQRPPNPFRSLS